MDKMKRVDLDEVERKCIIACADDSQNIQVAEAISAMIAALPSIIKELRLRRRAMKKGCFASGDCDDCGDNCPVKALEAMAVAEVANE